MIAQTERLNIRMPASSRSWRRTRNGRIAVTRGPSPDDRNALRAWGKAIQELRGSRSPQGLQDIDKIISSSRRLLDFKDNWDGEGAVRVQEQTWRRAVDFLRQNLTLLWEKHQIRAEPPSIVPVNDGSIDIHWKVEGRELLINIPPIPRKRATYYGDNKEGGNVVEGDFETDAQNHWLLVWLTE